MNNPHRIDELEYKFEELTILPPFTGKDGREYRYADAYVNGSADIAYDADGDWWVYSIWLETAERKTGTLERKLRHLDRADAVFALVKAALERECRDSINAAVAEHKAEAAA